MSYEGFVRMLCANGHERVFDAYAHAELHSPEHLCRCGAQFVWWRHVDETNGYEPETDPPLTVKEPARICKCPQCGQAHYIGETTYEIPWGNSAERNSAN